ncbi:MAG: hypothetical protein M1829_005872 [Trizodia sp. TS-e1964]|nr:MAG: hypothetical protein M1829_005872 [Trizodia sp. TS-e1964]
MASNAPIQLWRGFNQFCPHLYRQCSALGQLHSVRGIPSLNFTSQIRCLAENVASKPVSSKPAPVSSESIRKIPTKPYGDRDAPPSTARNTLASKDDPTVSPVKNLSGGFDDIPGIPEEGSRQVDWTRSFHGLSDQAFSKEAAAILLQPLESDDIEVKPDGILYLPEIKYRRILNKAFGPGAWGLAPRGETIVTENAVTREYALVVHGRLVSVARGEQGYFSKEGIATATEGCKSNAMMRCCKDLGVASELWDPRFIRKFIAQYAKEVFVEHAVTKRRKKIWLRKDDEVKYPFKETKGFA